MSSDDNDIITLSNKDIIIWTENDSSLHIKCVTKYGDPVELNPEEVSELCEILQALLKRIS